MEAERGQTMGLHLAECREDLGAGPAHLYVGRLGAGGEVLPLLRRQRRLDLVAHAPSVTVSALPSKSSAARLPLPSSSHITPSGTSESIKTGKPKMRITAGDSVADSTFIRRIASETSSLVRKKSPRLIAPPSVGRLSWFAAPSARARRRWR